MCVRTPVLPAEGASTGVKQFKVDIFFITEDYKLASVHLIDTLHIIYNLKLCRLCMERTLYYQRLCWFVS